MAADAAITGHLVFTTLHTGDAISSINRLIEMGLPAYLVAAAYRCIVSQRLRASPVPPLPLPRRAQRRALGRAGPGRGARRAHEHLHAGGLPQVLRHRLLRSPRALRVLTIDDELREMIAVGATVGEMRAAARARGIESIHDDGVRKVLDGSTSHLELVRVTA